jgi:3'(2'), 5'-bisphosphate nucleotidase
MGTRNLTPIRFWGFHPLSFRLKSNFVVPFRRKVETVESLRPLLLTALKASLQAGRAVMGVYGTDFEVARKEDSSPLTQADRDSHRVLAQALAPAGLPLLSEEGRDIPYAERRGWGDFWLVDPLDGTQEFVKKNGEFTVNVALVRQGRPVLGVVYAPALEALYFAADGQGAFRAGDPADGAGDWEALVSCSRRLSLPGFPSEGGALKVVASRSHLSKETQDLLGKWGKRYQLELVSAGSSLKFCLVAAGEAHLYPRFAPTMEWDTAAGQALVEQAGGIVLSRESRKALAYNKPDLLNPWFTAGSRQALRALE